MAFFAVWRARRAHFKRPGPMGIARSLSIFSGENLEILVFERPRSSSVSMDAAACEMAQPIPSKETSETRFALSNFRSMRILSPQVRLCSMAVASGFLSRPLL